MRNMFSIFSCVILVGSCGVKKKSGGLQLAIERFIGGNYIGVGVLLHLDVATSIWAMCANLLDKRGVRSHDGKE
jgi:hypothetical protein